MTNIVIGIDPDVDKSGIAQLDNESKQMQVSALPFPLLCAYLQKEKASAEQSGKSIVVLIEAGWLNHSNWHLIRGMTIQKAAQIGNATGRNHETGRKIAEMCHYFGITYKLIKPLKKMWKGADGKITAEEFSRITGCTSRTNQEMRDAGLIAYFYK